MQEAIFIIGLCGGLGYGVRTAGFIEDKINKTSTAWPWWSVLLGSLVCLSMTTAGGLAASWIDASLPAAPA